MPGPTPVWHVHMYTCVCHWKPIEQWCVIEIRLTHTHTFTEIRIRKKKKLLYVL